jgi:hypothetical protein
MLPAVSDWDWFLEHRPWFVRPGQSVVVGSASAWTRGVVPGLPRLSALLASARVTPVSVAGHAHELLTWDSQGWLCELPPDAGAESPGVLRDVWRVFGGIVELVGGPSTWWLNQTEVLTVSATAESLAETLTHYEWIWETNDLVAPIEEMRDYVTVAIEGNGNLTVAHRQTGRLVLFGPDHDFEGVTPLPGCPESSLYSFDELPDLASWIEACAGTWQARVS